MVRRDATRPDAVDGILAQWKRELPEMNASALEVFGRLHRVFMRYQTHLNETFSRHGINAAAFDILAALRRHGAPYRLTAGALADTSLITTGGISLRIDRLEKSGLVVRERDEDDRRVVYVQLTDDGRHLVEAVAADHFAAEDALLVALTATERRQLGQLLSRLERSLDVVEATTRTNDARSETSGGLG
ncbi:MarR family transcriptional regulator [Rhodococcus sp. 05-340-1]|uniref:MarR family winged helix-turn-helix transcriptional regulator n=1 Tax=unclassified Rhodococcus (in: high G+C Gram-positive bacteria) TaxID=192944 RepID=UPI000B9B2755|nr:MULTISPECIES: MarR family transcriptional regulator [unclassified Rhodococcus (in: high G+C Gram-positive bacteria)]OZD68864.1 MarR family transcriptional regulator [Rhodococcus sp. 05-340-2]OZD69337.1 MarR family transcriptional regulator [Rhodococcus sp. 05-340-1]